MTFLQLQEITKSFGGLVAVAGVSFSVESGEILALIGPNGAGKTTIFEVISGFLIPDTGQIKLGDIDIVGLRPHEICRQGIVRTFQIVKPFGGISVGKNVLIGALNRASRVRDAGRRAEEICRTVGLDQVIDVEAGSLPLPLRKRLELARALATEPRILLLDEVMAGLNANETDQIIQLIRMIRESGVTIVLIEHNMRGVMALADRIVVLNFGRKIAAGTPVEVVNDKEVIGAYLGEGV